MAMANPFPRDYEYAGKPLQNMQPPPAWYDAPAPVDMPTLEKQAAELEAHAKHLRGLAAIHGMNAENRFSMKDPGHNHGLLAQAIAQAPEKRKGPPPAGPGT